MLDRRALLPVLVLAAPIGCSTEPSRPPPGTPHAVEPAATVAAKAPDPVPEYVLAEPAKLPPNMTVAFENGVWGALLEERRAMVSARGVTFAEEVPDAAFRGVDRVPARLGGGYLFRTSSSLFASASFDGPLRPVVTVPAPITTVSFGPDAALVRASSGERWIIDLATGARRAAAPLGLVDIAALDDGRAAAVTAAGGLSLSTDGGKTWTDGRSHLRGAASGVLARGGDLWITDQLAQGARALRLETSGALSEIGARPPDPARPKPDPRFPGGESPLRLALRKGARVGPAAVVMAAGGDVLRVDLRSGALTVTAAGAVPQNMECEALEVIGDVLLVCASQSAGSVVMSGLLSDGAPRLERSFPTVGPFVTGEEGSLAYLGPCSPPPPAVAAPAGGAPAPDGKHDVCTRNTKGEWRTFRLKEDAERGELRWIPRLDQAPIAVIDSKGMAIVDASKGEPRRLQVEGHPAGLLDSALRLTAARRGSGHPIIDRRWSATPEGRARVMLEDGRALEISEDGVITAWPFVFSRVAVAGMRAFGRTPDGRAYQTVDGGQTWREVQGPPVPREGLFQLERCSALGCELGAFLRVGWEATPPAPLPSPKKVTRAPVVAAPPLLEMGCVGSGAVEARTLPRITESLEQLSLGAALLPKPPVNSDFELRRKPLGRAPVNVAVGGWESSGDVAPRALVSGFPLSVEWVDRGGTSVQDLVVLGPGRAAASFREEILFVEPLVPAAPVRRAQLGVDAVTRALKDSGISLLQLVESGGLEAAAVVPVTPAPAASGRAAAGGDVLVSYAEGPGTLYFSARGGASPQAEVLFARPGGIAQSAARLAGGDLVVLAASWEGRESILRFSSSGASEVARLPAPPTSALSPANPDAVAVGPRGEIGVIRMPSGAEPPSVGDPALLILPGPQVTALAPWSSAVPADDPACAGDSGAYRATIQTVSSWIRVVGLPFPDDSVVGMTARVRWSAARVCVEAVEVPASVGETPWGAPAESLVVATFGPASAARVSVEPGSESRAPLSCALSPR